MDLVFITQTVDLDHPALGFVGDWVVALSEHFDRVLVIQNSAKGVVRFPGLPASVSLACLDANGTTRAAKGAELTKVLRGFYRRSSRGGVRVLAHMCPIYLLAACPVSRLWNVPVWLWYAHPTASLQLKIAAATADGVLTSFPGAFPLASASALPIGQGIPERRFLDLEVARFRPTPWRGVAIGRTAPVKQLATVVRGVADAVARGVDITLDIVGPSLSALEEAYRAYLIRLIAELDLGHRVRVLPEVAYGELPNLLQSYQVVLNATKDGSGDKVVLEAALAGRVVLASNRSFFSLFEAAGVRDTQMFPEGDAAGLGEVLWRLWCVSPDALEEDASTLRQEVANQHGLSGWARRVSATIV